MVNRIFIPLVLALLVPIAGAQTYTVTDLGPLSPAAINTWGQVVGEYNGHAFMWTRSQGLRDLGILPGGTFSRATAINDLGTIAGTADGLGVSIPYFGDGSPQQCNELTQPFLWTLAKGMQPLGTVQIFGEEWWCRFPFHGTGINNLGQVIGFNYEIGTTYQFEFTWNRRSGMKLFGGSWPPSSADDISNTGQIVGQNSTSWKFGGGHAASWKNGLATDLGTLGPAVDLSFGYSSLASGVNDLGQIVGWSTTAPSVYGLCLLDNVSGDCAIHAVLWTAAGSIRDLGTLPGDADSVATKINVFGQVIGSSGNTVVVNSEGLPWDSDPPLYQVSGRPFIWSQRSGMRDLNSLIASNSGWVLNSASDINIWGQIVGSGTHNGRPRGFLLTPRTLLKF
jgi:probable HAF family extracellular repeat protein